MAFKTERYRVTLLIGRLTIFLLNLLIRGSTIGHFEGLKYKNVTRDKLFIHSIRTYLEISKGENI